MPRRLSLLLLAIFLVAWLPRVVALDRFVTPDERKWLARSANFYQALSAGDLEHTFQREHPGVTVMWAGTLGFLQRFPEYPQETPGQFTWERENIEAWLLEYTSHTPLELLAAGRWWLALWIAVALALAYLPLRRLFGAPAALFATLFVIWDPFGVALSRQLHPDGLSAALLYLALAAFLAWLYAGRQARYLLLSSVVMALAWLTKSPTILLLPVAVLLIAREWMQGERMKDESTATTTESVIHPSSFRPHPSKAERLTLLRGLVTWGALATLLFFILWPSMWVDPVGTLGRMATEASEYVEGHVNTNYFLGRPTEDPGALFYPIAYLFRATPAVLLGLAAALVWFVRRDWPLTEPTARRAGVGLALFALLFMMVITVGAKKFDRYLLPSFFPLDVLAALGWSGMIAKIKLFQRPLLAHRYLSPAFLVAAMIAASQALPVLLTYPYYLTYYNPLVGGSRTAPEVLFVGWGEGLDEAAAWLNRQPEAEKLRVVSWYADGPFSYLFRGQSALLTRFAPLTWLDTDYVVLYSNQWQRQEPSAEALGWFTAREPAHTVWADGLELARVYDMRDAPLPDFIDMADERRADFGGKIRLSAYRLEQNVAEPGDRFRVTFYLQSLMHMEKDYNVLARLVGADGQEIWRDEGWPWGAPTSDWPLREIRPDGHEIVIPEDAPPGLYTLTLALYDPESLTTFPVTLPGGTQPTGETERAVDLIRVGPAPLAEQRLAPAPTFQDVIRLAGVTLPEGVERGEELHLALQWESLKHTTEDYTVFVHLVGPGGTLVAQQDRQPLAGQAPTHLWDPGEQYLDEYTLPVPQEAPPGQYEVRVGLYTLDGGRLPVSRDGAPTGDFVTIGLITVP